MQNTETVVAVEEAVVAHRTGLALQGVSFHVRRGEFVGIIGPNGAGKTTLLTLINGLGRLSSGQVRVLGRCPFGREGHRVRRRVGYVAQVERLDPRLPIRVRETVLAGCYGRRGWLRRPAREDYRWMEEVLARVGVGHLAERPIGHLSGGEYQRVALARVLLQQPDIYLFDEPTASIDPRAQADILRLVQELHREERATVIYVTHELGTLPEACSRLALMKDGRIWREGPRTEMLRAEVLEPLYHNGNAAAGVV